MTKNVTEFDPAPALNSPVAIDVFIGDAFKTVDSGYIARDLGVVARIKGVSQIAHETGLSRAQLHRSLSEEGNPTLKTTLAVMQSLGLELTTKPLSAV